ncbi:hypothetical protein BS47DRAFT_1372487 [Hydnum rufescens UP504]|uniref:SAM-dependent MTase RsmB/NOP-type domain-containing protein n=1 Tax=Hydnum rufescens UP504 TaxID=1448309 RepID=A0A9P6AXG6_9AGAM|nr:hypothetical protein BS47DRAFT_1372487 [Hydnum rufescens UP504]
MCLGYLSRIQCIKQGGQRGRGRGGGRGPRSQVFHSREDLFTTNRINSKFETYYKAQDMIPEDEWIDFLTTLKEPLPTTFRLTGSRTTARDLNGVIQETYIPHLTNQTWEGNPIPPPTQLPWYPDGLGWQLKVHKQIVRKSPEFKKFQNFLVYETEVGNISRQEAVSMIPPLVLDVESHHAVLDMCAAPGSKYSLHSCTLDGTASGGAAFQRRGAHRIVIANDNDYKRSHMLVHQSARLPSPNLMVTNLDASLFPGIRVPPSIMPFDRILCDVPCSGDGTLRKNIAIWKSWGPQNANGLHSLQVRILLRAMSLLGSNGRIVYSTVPVLATALNSHPGRFVLEDVSTRLPGLLRRPGLKSWKVAIDKNITLASSWSSYLSTLTDPGEAKLSRSLFPPDNANELNLERCMRIYPHMQDTGGFFVAVLVRVKDHDVVTRESSTSSSLSQTARDAEAKKLKVGDDALEDTLAPTPDEELDDIVAPAPDINLSMGDTIVMGEHGEEKLATTGGVFNETPYTYLASGNRHAKACLESLRVNADFPSTLLFVRNPDGENITPRVIYFSNPLVREIVLHNDFNKLRLINCGVKVFTRQDSTTSGGNTYRFVDDGIESVLPYVPPESILTAGIKELKIMLESYYPLSEAFDEGFREQIKQRAPGSYLIRFEAGEWEGASLRNPLLLPFWISSKSTSLMTDKQTKSALCLRLFGEDITPFGKENRQKKEAMQAQVKDIETTAVVGDLDVAEKLNDGEDDLEVKVALEGEGDISD